MSELAAVRRPDGTIVVEETPFEDNESADDVIVAVTSCGICGSDLRSWRAAPSTAQARPGAGGHEVVGRLAASGLRVVVDPSAVGTCGRCEACQAGAHWFCSRRTATFSGGFATRVRAPRHALHYVPAGLTDELAALAEPVACGVHAVRHSWTAHSSGSLSGVDVAVIGAGALGLGAVMAAQAEGARRVAVVARHDFQERAAASLRPTETVTEAAAPAELRRLRPALVIDAVGSTESAELAEQAVAWRGEVVDLGAAGVPRGGPRSSAHEHRFFHPVAYAGLGGVHDIDVALALLERRAAAVSTWPLASYPLEEVDAAFRRAADRPSGVVRVLVEPDHGATPP